MTTSSSTVLEVTALGKGRILRNLASFLPVTLFATIFYGLFPAVILTVLLRFVMDEAIAAYVALAGSLIVSGVGMAFYVRFVVNRLAQSYLRLDADAVVFRGQTANGLTEKRFAVGAVRWVAFGEQLNAAEDVMDRLNRLGVPRMGAVGLLKELKAGRLIVADRSGRKTVFHFTDAVFDPASVGAFAAELSRRGVEVMGAGVANDGIVPPTSGEG